MSTDPEFLVPFYAGMSAGFLIAAAVVATILAVCLWRLRPGRRDG